MPIVPDCLGMEFELSTPTVILNLGSGPVEEGVIKGVSLGKILDGKVDVTLDPRTGYSGRGEESVAIELVLDHKFFPVESLKNFGAELAQEIDRLDMTKYLSSLPYKTKEKITATTSGKKAIVTLMIHVTCSCPLESIYETECMSKDEGISGEADGVLQSESISGIQYKQIMCFVYLLHKMAEGCGPDPAKSDPKQGMCVMNRTSFGAIFAKFDKTLQPIIIEALSGLSYYSTMQISENAGTIGELYQYLKDLRDGTQRVSDDPTFKANEMGEKLSISALGDTFVQKEGEFWPVFEFRGCGTVNKSELPPYIDFVLEELRCRNERCVTFTTNQRFWEKK